MASDVATTIIEEEEGLTEALMSMKSQISGDT